MPPKTRRKLNSSTSSSKKSNVSNNQSQVQPSKFGIQHFFERHSQSTLLASQHKHTQQPSPPPPPPTASKSNDDAALPLQESAPNGVVSVQPNPNSHPDSTPVIEVDDDVSPLITKSTSLTKRFNFSPGMLIQQSQDDGGDEVTWKISPVNERLLAASKHVHLLTDSSKNNPFSIHQCSQTKQTDALQGVNTSAKVSKWLSSPSPSKAGKKPSLQGNKVGLKRLNPFLDKEVDENTCSASRQTPFCTPPSLQYSPDKIANGVAFHNMGSKHHKKALLELLDEVEDVISVEDFVSSESESYSYKVQEEEIKGIPVTANSIGNDVVMDTTNKVSGTSSNGYFLVLEVSEKRTLPESGGSVCPYKVLRLVNEKSGEERAVYLLEEWSYSVIAPGDTVNVIGEFDEEGKCNVDHENNFLIIHPDILVSGTRVAGSFSCPRRTVLDERLRSNEHSTAALIGTLLHQIFQAGLVKESPTVHFLEDYARIVLQKNMESLYACGVNEKEIYKTLIDAIPKLVNWIVLFKEPQVPTVDFGSDNGAKQVKRFEVIDIEELAWAPKYGLKGMVDVSVRVKFESGGKEDDEKIMPLEFKTGKMLNGQASIEHRAQVILYTLLMSERYLTHIDSGLLYYLQTDQTQGIVVRRTDMVGLIMRRNELANDILKALTTQQLPPMLQTPSMCKGCRHLDVCTLYHKAFGGDTESSGLGDIFDSRVHNFSNAHGIFLRHWDRLIDLEAKGMQLAKKEIWRSHNLENEDSAGCLSSLVLDELPQKESQKENRFIYHFVRRHLLASSLSGPDRNFISAASSLTKDLDCTLKSGDYVVLSTESGRQIVATGVIVEISPDRVSVSFSKGLRLPGGNLSSMTKKLFQEVWRINKDEITTSFSVMRFNLIQMFLENERSSHLRKTIVDLAAPRFDSGCIFSQDPAISYIWSEKSLNDDQRRAILKILTAKDYALILGMPGTGKTSTMVHAVKALLMRGASILLTSYTNSAVDNLLIKLKSQGIDFVRIGRLESVHEEIKEHCFSGMNLSSVEEIKLKFDQVKVVAVTCLGITSPLLSGKKFDVCIIDEAGQTTLPVSLGPLMFASTFVLVGDHYQLPPLVQSTEAREKGMGISLFCRLSEAHPQAIAPLQSQYRMCQSIMELSNALIYGDRLSCGSPEIANAELKFTKPISCRSSWLKIVLNPSKPVIFVNTDMLPAFEVRDQKTVNNPTEASIIAEITDGLVNNGIEGKDIGIITPYNSQANIIRHACKASSVETHTIDRYQGRDKDCILVSFVRSNKNPRNCTASLLGDWHRINVALTRPKKKLIMVGSCRTLSKVPLLKLLIDKVDNQSGILSLSNEDFNRQASRLQRCSQSEIR